MVIVTAAIIVHHNKVLLAQRKLDSHLALKWEFPGGKLEEGEEPEACLVREIKEELHINIEVIDVYKVILHKYESKTVLLLCYLCRMQEGVVVPLECNDFAWVCRADLITYDFAPADLPAVEKLTKDFGLFRGIEDEQEDILGY